MGEFWFWSRACLAPIVSMSFSHLTPSSYHFNTSKHIGVLANSMVQVEQLSKITYPSATIIQQLRPLG